MPQRVSLHAVIGVGACDLGILSDRFKFFCCERDRARIIFAELQTVGEFGQEVGYDFALGLGEGNHRFALFRPSFFFIHFSTASSCVTPIKQIDIFVHNAPTSLRLRFIDFKNAGLAFVAKCLCFVHALVGRSAMPFN